MQNSTQHTVLFPELFSKPIHVAFCREELSSNGGTVLLAARDRQLKLTESLSDVLTDRRQPGKVHHQYLEQMRQRVYGIALGCPDGNDAEKLRNDPMLKLGCDRDPHKGEALASQASLSRFDNLPSRTQQLRMAYQLAKSVISTQAAKRTAKKRPRRIIIDVDPTCDPTHGAQQMTFFNGFYRTWCYLPLVVTISFDSERRKYPVAVLLRSGNSGPQAGAITVLKRLLPMLRLHFPRTQIYFRADAGFASHQIINFLDAEGLHYAISMGANSRLKELSSDWMQIVRHMVGEHGKKVTIHRETT